MLYGICLTLINNQIKTYEHEKGVNIKDLEKNCENLYNQLGLKLNISSLGNEIENTKTKIKKIDMQIDLNEWNPLVCVYQNAKVAAPNKRNFFAHAGLESNLTEFRVVENSIFVRYIANDNYIKNVKKWLKDSII